MVSHLGQSHDVKRCDQSQVFYEMSLRVVYQLLDIKTKPRNDLFSIRYPGVTLSNFLIKGFYHQVVTES